MSHFDLARATRGVDAMLRRRLGIVEYADDPDCLFRISVATAGRALTLSDGVAIAIADPVVQIHYWNEHMPVMPEHGRSAAWANLFKHGVRHSLVLLAEHIQREPRFSGIVAINAEPAFSARLGPGATARVSAHLGFDIVETQQHDGAIHAWLDSLLVWTLIRAFNPAGLPRHGVSHSRLQIWMSRETLLHRYGSCRDNDAMTGATLERS